ncbi:rho GTPase-activating protein 21-like isoform X2 [Oncorhynchus keta]|uniref:rho GTPase-activating protein 21-like isoform X2 n=1 Tax=Oncorhynchus keta TaxID=8018 RepID=UPI0015FD0408|nr:rho GTPase-activating protein 21-like isoform X2 [Oncorhynchus keta]
MMASHWKGPCDEEDEGLTRSSLCENNVPEWRVQGDSPACLFNLQGEEEPFSWPGPKTLSLRRTSQGFGFTLRHFIVYPPESAVHPYPFPEEEHGRRGRQRNRLEPMDTIFVKQVKEGGPANEAGLCTGDRIVKVNGASIIGKTYSQVIALIQNSDAFLDLCVMPKDEDILQLAYSQDAYLRSRSTYSGNARHIPEPPPICYPRVDCKPPGMAQATETPSPVGVGVQGACRGATPPDTGYRMEIPVPPSPPPPAHPYPKSQTAACMRNDSVRTVVVPPELGRIGPAHRIDCNLVGSPDPGLIRVRPGSVSHYPLPRKTDIYPSGASLLNYSAPLHQYSPNPVSHQNIDWRTYQTYREYIDNKSIHAYGSQTIQERLECLRAASQNTFNSSHHIPRSGWGPNPKGLRRRSTSHDRAYHGPPPPFHHMPPRSSSQDRMSMAERGVHPRNWPPRSVSQDGLTHKARARSSDCDYVDSVELGRPMVDRRGYASRLDQGTRPSRQSLSKQAVHHRPPAGYGRDSLRGTPMPNPTLYAKGPEQLQHQPHGVPNMTQDRPSHLGKIISLEPSPTDQRAGVKDVNHVSQSRGRAETMQPAGEVPGREVAAVVGHRSSSLSASHQRPQRLGILKTSHHHPPRTEPQAQVNGRGPSASELGVVLREKPPGSVKNPSPLRHPSYILAVNEEDGLEPAADSMCWLPNDARREMHMRRLSKKQEKDQTSCSSSNLEESLDSIPFIDEPASPSVDHEATSIPASAVISGIPAVLPLNPSSSPCPFIRRQMSHDQDSLRNAILESDASTKQERSKSCDEGLDNYREEGRGRSNSKHMPGLRGLRKALDGHKSSDDSGSRRDSSSDIFSDSSKEGWLNFRQLNTEKSKRVSGGSRSWKQMYAVLRGHALTLYKDKKDGISHASSHSQSDDDPQPISIKACLIDISYSDTKRKNVLRLTTSHCGYLFQAEGRDDMLSWIRVIQENSNLDDESAGITSQDLISRKIREYNTMMSAPSTKTEPSPKTSRQSLSIRHTLLGGKGEGKSPHSPKTGERDDSSPPRDKAAWRRGIPGIMRKPFEKKATAGVTFGVRLDDCPSAQNNRFVPLIVEVCCKLVEERGLEYTGIYRVPGNNAAISSMQEELDNKGLMSDIDIQEDKWRDLNVISSLLKSFFRKLPEPLFTNEKYADFIEANRTEDAVERLKELKRLILELPEHHYETLKFLSGHLKLVSENCEKNKMEPRNLAIVFGPTLVRTSEDNMTNMVNHMPDQCKIVENLIQQFDWFFTEEGDDDPVTSVEQESTVQSQPVPNIDHLLSNIGRTTTTTSAAEVSDSACSDSSKSKGLWGSGKDQCSREMLRSSFFVSRKRKKPKDKAQPSSSDDDLDAVFAKKEQPEQQSMSHQDLHPTWSPDSQTDVEREASERGEQPGDRVQTNGKESSSDGLMSQPSPSPSPKHTPSPCPRTSSTRSPYTSQSPRLGHRRQVAHQSSLSDPPSNYDEVSDLGTMNSTSSQASVTGPRVRHGRTGALGPETGASGLGAEVSSITSDYSTTSSMTFLTGAELSTLCPEVHSVAESRGGDDADDERSELISEGRPMETDSESDLSVFIGSVKETRPGKDFCQSDMPGGPRPLPSHRLIECDTLSRKKSAACQKTDSDSSLDGGQSDKDSNRLARVLGVVKGRSTSSLSSSSRSESEKGIEPAWHLKITDRLKFRLRTSVDDMFGVGTQQSRSPEGRRDKKKNIRRRHTMGGQRDFAELSVMGDWQGGMGGGSRAELSAVDRLKPKCSSQDFSIREWIARERHRTSNPEVSLDFSEHQGALLLLRNPDLQNPNHQVQEAPSSSLSDPLSSHPTPAELLNGDTGPQSKSLNLSATAHPHKLSGAQVVQSRFYQYL